MGNKVPGELRRESLDDLRLIEERLASMLGKSKNTIDIVTNSVGKIEVVSFDVEGTPVTPGFSQA